MKNIKFTLSRIDHIPDYISSEALDYWFTNDNFTQLMKIIYKSSISHIKGGHTSEVTFEVYFPNY